MRDSSPGEGLISVSFNTHFHLSFTCEQLTICIVVAAVQPRARFTDSLWCPRRLTG